VGIPDRGRSARKKITMTHPMDNLERMEDAWDRMSVDYGDRLKLAPSDAHYQALAGHVPITQQPIRILDLGCGLGYELDMILDRAPFSQVTCMDISEKMLCKLKQRLISLSARIETRHESYVDAELDAGAFDFVVSSLTVHHLPRPTKRVLFQKILSALRPGGSYFELDDVNSPEDERIGQQWYEEYVATRKGGERGEWNHNMSFTISNEQVLLKEVGFSPVTVPWTATDDKGNGRALFVAKKPKAEPAHRTLRG